jgi:hypothetical protein
VAVCIKKKENMVVRKKTDRLLKGQQTNTNKRAKKKQREKQRVSAERKNRITLTKETIRDDGN